jgi:hypothetical protein
MVSGSVFRRAEPGPSPTATRVASPIIVAMSVKRGSAAIILASRSARVLRASSSNSGGMLTLRSSRPQWPERGVNSSAASRSAPSQKIGM